MIKNGFRYSFFKNRTLIDKKNSCAYFSCKSHFMCNNNHGHSFLGKLFHQLQNLSNHLRIQCRSRLVKKHNGGLHG